MYFLLRNKAKTKPNTRAEFLGSDRLFCVINISKFDSCNNSFTMITSFVELHLRCRRCILLVQTEEAISMSYGSSKSYWKPSRWMRLDLIFFTMRDIYINCQGRSNKKILFLGEEVAYALICNQVGAKLQKNLIFGTILFTFSKNVDDTFLNTDLLEKFSSNSRRTALKDILSWNISQMMTRTILISTRIVVSWVMKRGTPLSVSRKVVIAVYVMSRPSLLLYITFVNTFSLVKNIFSKGKKVIVWKFIFPYYFIEVPGEIHCW